MVSCLPYIESVSFQNFPNLYSIKFLELKKKEFKRIILSIFFVYFEINKNYCDKYKKINYEKNVKILHVFTFRDFNKDKYFIIFIYYIFN